jgi:hypothetical protein
MLKNHVDSAFRENPNRPPRDLLVALRDALRNSLHVSKIEAGKDLELPDATLSEQWSSTVIEYASSLLAAEQTRVSNPEAVSRKTGPATRKYRQMPSSVAAWPLQRSLAAC